jgi:hypothetical protein
MSAKHADAWFKDAPPIQRATLLELRKLILSVAPDAVEEIKWSRPCYRNARGMFCYLHSTQSHATLGFQKGSALKDADHLLEGGGKDMRHIKFQGGLGSHEPGIRKLLRQAVSL